MNKKQYKKILESAEETLADLEEVKGNLTKGQFLLMGAATALLDHERYAASEKSEPHDESMKMPASGNRAPETFSDFAALVEEELEGAEKYLAYFQQTGDESYRHLSKQEEAHAMFFIEKAKAAAQSPDQGERVRQYKQRYDAIMQALPPR